MKKKEITKTTIITGIIGILFLIVGLTNRNFEQAKKVYQVYLNGNKLGLIEIRVELFALINEEQKVIIAIYNVSDVYPPNGFIIKEYQTYNKNVVSAKEIYEKIKNQEDFTIEGYIVKIKFNSEEKEDITLNVLNREIFEEALTSVITAFVKEEDFKNYINNTQMQIEDVGQIIENMYFQETITIKNAYMSVNEKIFTDANELTQYLLFGSSKEQSNYTVAFGDTISSISEANKLNPQEFLIANPKYKSKESILAIGDKVNITLINPILTLVESIHSVEDQEQAYEKEEVYDNSKPVSFKEVTQTGITGIERITRKMQVINGEQTQGVDGTINAVTLRESQKEITTKGGYPPKGSYVDNGRVWGWPTNRPYIITSGFEYRWGAFHNAIDISGTGMGSPIYASRAGVVVEMNNICANIGSYRNSCGRTYGNFVVVSHGDGYYTMYAHLLQDVVVNVGDKVSRGQILGYMGSSGSSTGAHLHFGVSKGEPDRGTWLNPWSVLR